MATPSVEQQENQDEAAYQSLIPQTGRVTQEVIPPETDPRQVTRPETDPQEVTSSDTDQPEACLPQQTRPNINSEETDRPDSVGPIFYDYPYQHMIQRIRRFFGPLLINRQSYLEPTSSTSCPRPPSSNSGYLDPVSHRKSPRLSSAHNLRDKSVIIEDSNSNVIEMSHSNDSSSERLEYNRLHNNPMQQLESETDQSFAMTTLRPLSNREESLYAEIDETKMF